MRIRRREPQAEDFQMAPMIDMVFLLLVFFMCVSSLSQAQRRTPVDLPESTESDVPSDLADRILITVLADGTTEIGGAVVGVAALGEAVRATLRERPGSRFQVRADRATPFSELKKVLRTCAEAGALEVIYATHQAGG